MNMINCMKSSRTISKVTILFLFLMLLLVPGSCRDTEDQMPNISFELYVHIPTQLADLSVSGSKTWPQGGFNGLIIHRSGQYEYKAFERTCTHQPLEKCILEIEDILFALCPCCQSRFVIPFEGAVDRGPAKRPLKQYRTSIVGVNLRIYN